MVAVLPGATPADLERQVVQPLEARLKTIDDLKTTKTRIEDGVAVVQVEFTAGSDPARRRDDVLRETDALRPSLPPELLRLDVQEFKASKVNVLELALVTEEASNRTLDELGPSLAGAAALGSGGGGGRSRRAAGGGGPRGGGSGAGGGPGGLAG